MKAFDKEAFRLKVEERSKKLIPKSDDKFEDLVKQLSDELQIYAKSRSRTMSLTIAVFKTKLWNQTHTNFADFLMDRFSIKKSYAYLLIKSAKIVDEIPEYPVENERQARAHESNTNNGVSESQNPQQNAENTVRTGTEQNSTNGGNRNSVKAGSKPSSKDDKVELDRVGTPIPNDAIPFWNRQQEVQDILTQISRLKGIVVKARNSEDALWMVIDNFVSERFDQLHSVISQAKPFAVCTQCMGSPTLQPAGCSFCHSTGLISKWKWDTCSPKELKELRLKSNIEYAKSHNINTPVPA